MEQKLVNAIRTAFNEIPNKKINDPYYPDTYSIASALDKLFEGQPTYDILEAHITAIQPPVLPKKRNFTVSSSGGEIVVNKYTGHVISFRANDPDYKDKFASYYQFDVKEYKAYYKLKEMADDVDILDIGVWLLDKNNKLVYDPAVKSWREEVGELREGNEL